MIRSVSTALFLNAFGAKSSPYVWLYSIISLSIVVALYNKFQIKATIHRIFLLVSLSSAFLLLTFFFLAEQGSPYWTYALFVLKEIYIVLLVHSLLGYLNSAISADLAKIIYGPLGAWGSIGGLLGGTLTSQLHQN